jgi:hypothetical protein
METSTCKPCAKCPVWEKLATDLRYRSLVTTRSIGGERDVSFVYLPRDKKGVIILPCRPGKKPVAEYPAVFDERQFKVMCCRFSYVTKAGPNPPSHFVGNDGQFNESKTNPPGWTPPAGVFVNRRKDPPYVVAVVRKVLEDNPTFRKCGYCSCQNNCK